MWKSFSVGKDISFRCYEGHWDVIPKPYPARYDKPDWYKKIPARIKENPDKKGPGNIKRSTIRRCTPVQDAMEVGWIIPLAADVSFTSNENASEVSYEWSFGSPMVENHSAAQIGGEAHPDHPKPPMKFLNWWQIKVPDNYSVLFVPPLNRPNPWFTCMSGFVDCDKYDEFINFPFIWHAENYEGHIPAGTPLVQVIPIKRNSLIKNGSVEPMTVDQYEDLEKLRRKRASHESLYRDTMRERKW